MSDATASLTPEQCIPDVPDAQAAIDNAIATAKGKVPEISFRPVNFNANISKFFTFDFFGRILGKSAGGLDYDTCAVTIEGDIDGSITGGAFHPDTAGEKLQGMQDELDAIEASLDSGP